MVLILLQDQRSSQKDQVYNKIKRRDGEYKASSFEDLKKSIEIFDEDRPLSHLDKVKLIKGDIIKTSKDMLKKILHKQSNITYWYEFL